MIASAATASSSIGFMGDTMAGRVEARHPQQSRSRKVRAALALGCSVAVADKKLYGEHAAHLETARIITADLAAEDYESVAAVMAPIDAALAGQREVSLADAMFAYDSADAAEDLAQAAWLHEKSDETLAAYARKIGHELYHGNRLLACIHLEQANRKAAR